MKKLFTRMGHSAVSVSDVGKAIEFYRDKLGLDVEWSKDKDWANMKIGGDDLSLVLAADPKNPPHIGFRVETREDLREAHAQLKKAGVAVEEIHGHRDGTISFYFRDPDQNILEALWDPRQI